MRGLLAKRYGCAAGRLAMGARAMALEAAVVAYDDENSAVESECPERVEDRQWCEKWWRRLLCPIMEEERQLRAVKEQVMTACIPETVEESGDEEPTQPMGPVVVKPANLGPDDGLDALRQDELEMKQLREEEAVRQQRQEAMLERQLVEYEEEREREKQEDEARYEELQAQYAQEWDDWVMWRSLHATNPARDRPVKKQKLALSVQVQGEMQPRQRIDFEVAPGIPMTLGLTWALVDAEPVEESVTGGSQSSTERVSPVTPEPPKPVQSVVQGKGQIVEGELSAFMSGEEGLSVFQAWCSGGFTSEQISRLYGEAVLETFLANRLDMEASQCESG